MLQEVFLSPTREYEGIYFLNELFTPPKTKETFFLCVFSLLPSKVQIFKNNRAFRETMMSQFTLCRPTVALCYEHSLQTTTMAATLQFLYVNLALL